MRTILTCVTGPGILMGVVTLAVLMIAPLAVAANGSHSRALSNDVLVERVVSLYRPGSGDTSGYSGTSMLKMVRQRWDTLSKEQRKRVAAFLDEPVRTGPGAPDGQRILDTEHFQVIYQTKGDDAVPDTDADGDSVPDYARQVAMYLEKAWQTEVCEFGFDPPPGSGDQKVRCYLRNINHNGLTHAATGKTAWMEINSDIVTYTKGILGEAADDVVADTEGLQAGMLKACCAHEFFHCIQAAYDWDEDNWWCEGSAEWAGNAVFPESKFYTNNVRPRFEHPNVSLFSREGWYEYASSIWAVFLAENYGGYEIIRAIWEGCRHKTVRQATEDAIGDMREQFMFFACYNYLRVYKDGKRFPEMKATRLEAAGTVDSTGLEAPQCFGTNYFVVPGEIVRHVSVDLDGNSPGDVRIIVITDGRWKILPHKAEDGKFSVDIPGGSDIDEVVVVIAGFQEDGELHYVLTVS